MTFSRALILLIAVYFQPASCARLKKSATQRKLTQVALANGGKTGVAGGPNAVIVSKSLEDERDKIHGYMIEEEARLKVYELDLAKANADLGHQKYLLKHEAKVWKAWNWRIWSDKLPNIEKEIARLETKVQNLEHLITTANESIKNFKDAKQWAHDAAQNAMKHEELIKDLQKQLESVRDDHVKTVQAYEVQERQAKEDGEEKLRLFEVELAALTAEIAKQQAVLDDLNNGEHDLQVKMKTTRANMKATIDGHALRIKHLTAAILDNERETTEAENAREQSKDKYEAALSTLREGRKALEADRTTEHGQLAAAQQDLDRETKEGNARIDELKRTLNEQLAGLNADIEARRGAIQKQKIDNEAKLLALNAKYTDEVERKTQQMNDFISAQNESREELESLKKVHLAEASGDAIVSEALHKAKEDLEFKIKLQEDAKGAAESNIERIKRTITIKNAELAHEDKWYKFWNWEIWSRTKTDLKAALGQLEKDKATEEGRMINCGELISRLSTQIESKLTASKLAEVQEVAIDELERQIQDKRNDVKQTLEDEQTERALAKETGEDQVLTFENMLRELKAQQSTAKATLDQLESGTHDMHQNLADVKAALSGIISVHTKAIQNLTAAISINQNNENEIAAAEKNDVADHEDLITTLEKDKVQMTAHRVGAEDVKKTEEATLANLEANHQASVDDLKVTLSNTIEDLKQSRADQLEDFEAQKLAKEKVLQMGKEAHSNDLASLKAQIDGLTDSKAEAAKDLKEIHDANS